MVKKRKTGTVSQKFGQKIGNKIKRFKDLTGTKNNHLDREKKRWCQVNYFLILDLLQNSKPRTPMAWYREFV